MARRRVLIVDDSKTAQIRLRKMLERFDLEVDTVLSAEEALGYLSYRQPAVIFLDHHMEGMDGLEALKIIKSNPGTALIPVIMYTSEQGDVYVGQARALGAIDILSKEVMKYANLEKVLGSLGIAEKGEEESAEAATEAPVLEPIVEGPIVKPSLTSFDAIEAEPPAPIPATTSELDQVQRQISRLFEIHIAKVRQEIEDSTKFLLRRISKEWQDKNKPANRATNITPDGANPPPPIEPFVVEQETEKSGVSTFFLGIILLGIAFLGYHLYINNRHQTLMHDQYAELIERIRAQEELINRLFTKANNSGETKVAANAYADRQVLLDALSWAVNVNTQVPFGEVALGDERIYMLGELLALLKAANFSGAVYLDIHLGNFCVVEDPGGGWILPDPESNLEDCVFLANRVPQVAVEEQVSVGFLNYLHSAPILLEGDMEVELSSQSYSVPRYTYPATTNAVSAGQWNAIAHKNNRITVSFSAN
jgi:CheY-like chemotaxis protein